MSKKIKTLAEEKFEKQFPEFLKQLGKLITSAKVRSYVSEESFAKLCGIGIGHLRNLEKGHKTPSLEVLYKMSLHSDFNILKSIEIDKSNKTKDPSAKSKDALLAEINELSLEERKIILGLLKNYKKLKSLSIN